jgi:hypothetical protein
MSTAKPTPIQSKVIKGFWFVWADKPKISVLTTIYTGTAMRFDALPAATLVYSNPMQVKHAAQIFNIGMYATLENENVADLKAKIETYIERYLQEREKKA